MSVHDYPRDDDAERDGFLKSPAGLVLVGFRVAAFSLVTEHAAHLLGILPWLLLAACPLTHFFMHHGHGGHSSHARNSSDGESK